VGRDEVLPDAHVLVPTPHQVISDGWYVAIALDELIALHRAFREGEPSPLKPIPLTCLDHTRRQRSCSRAQSRTPGSAIGSARSRAIPSAPLSRAAP
jgi:hypothetical protein